jgi:hypothetical protein
MEPPETLEVTLAPDFATQNDFHLNLGHTALPFAGETATFAGQSTGTTDLVQGVRLCDTP